MQLFLADQGHYLLTRTKQVEDFFSQENSLEACFPRKDQAKTIDIEQEIKKQTVLSVKK
jgi:hypothetical protein